MKKKFLINKIKWHVNHLKNKQTDYHKKTETD